MSFFFACVFSALFAIDVALYYRPLWYVITGLVVLAAWVVISYGRLYRDKGK